MALIDRDALCDKVHDFFCDGCPVTNNAVCNCCDYRGLMDEIKAIPVVDAKPVVHGEWVIDKEHLRTSCSVCGNTLYYANEMQIPLIMSNEKYCSNCGADLRGDAHES